MTVYEQDGHDLRLEWGYDGVRALGPHCAVLVVVDVLVFTTTVDVALGRGGRVLPLPWHDERAARAAEAAGATLTPSGLTVDGTRVGADRRPGWSLRPSSLVDLQTGTFLAITSPNGATLCAAGAETGATVLAGCLRNASAVAEAAVELAGGRPVGIVPAGERWRDTEDRRLRPSTEDWLGAAAVAAAIRATSPSAEVVLAATTFRAAGDRVPDLVAGSVSGRELTEAGLADDVALASDVDSSTVVPMLADGVLVAA
ncbi:2-phosphosulfolactate phosphatase [Actinophytocola gossypii]|uniref:Probable 2-phosphosulfolactate phosphatase n=1 Tax=Actinophytocola gossypii TaxID=2812003 RepID=A0ABT2JG67_9PSEU|nr:2-phosphosulfolactate phosphatase [Actinophytocola gossypii]MCT2586859.1 2-phosphosulfolactate phosphatase [Actinophytocola gossypii]